MSYKTGKSDTDRNLNTEDSSTSDVSHCKVNVLRPPLTVFTNIARLGSSSAQAGSIFMLRWQTRK